MDFLLGKWGWDFRLHKKLLFIWSQDDSTLLLISQHAIAITATACGGQQLNCWKMSNPSDFPSLLYYSASAESLSQLFLSLLSLHDMRLSFFFAYLNVLMLSDNITHWFRHQRNSEFICCCQGNYNLIGAWVTCIACVKCDIWSVTLCQFTVHKSNLKWFRM